MVIHEILLVSILAFIMAPKVEGQQYTTIGKLPKSNVEVQVLDRKRPVRGNSICNTVIFVKSSSISDSMTYPCPSSVAGKYDTRTTYKEDTLLIFDDKIYSDQPNQLIDLTNPKICKRKDYSSGSSPKVTELTEDECNEIKDAIRNKVSITDLKAKAEEERKKQEEDRLRKVREEEEKRLKREKEEQEKREEQERITRELEERLRVQKEKEAEVERLRKEKEEVVTKLQTEKVQEVEKIKKEKDDVVARVLKEQEDTQGKLKSTQEEAEQKIREAQAEQDRLRKTLEDQERQRKEKKEAKLRRRQEEEKVQREKQQNETQKVQSRGMDDKKKNANNLTQIINRIFGFSGSGSFRGINQ